MPSMSRRVLWTWFAIIMLSFTTAQTTEIDLMMSMENYCDSLAGSIVTTSDGFTTVHITCRPISPSLCASTPLPFPEEMTYGSNTQEWALHSEHFDSPAETFDIISAAIRCLFLLPTAGTFCGKTRIMVWSSGVQTWTSTTISTTSFANSEIPQAKLLVTAGVDKLQDPAQIPVGTVNNSYSRHKYHNS